MKKTDLDVFPSVTLVYVSQSGSIGRLFPNPPSPLDTKKIPALVSLVDSHRANWTRAFAVGFGPPSPVYYAHLFHGDIYLGYFAVGSGALPGSAALFEVRYGDVYARKRVTPTEANRFLDVIGVGGELGETPPHQTVARAPRERRLARPAKFQPGDRVVVKAGRVQGKVVLQTRFFAEDVYWVTVPGPFWDRLPVREREERVARHETFVSDYGALASPEFLDYPKPYHDEGPFYEAELEPTHK